MTRSLRRLETQLCDLLEVQGCLALSASALVLLSLCSAAQIILIKRFSNFFNYGILWRPGVDSLFFEFLNVYSIVIVSCESLFKFF